MVLANCCLESKKILGAYQIFAFLIRIGNLSYIGC